MSGPYLSYVLPSFASKPARTLKVCTLKEHLIGLIKIWNIYVTKNIDNINIIIKSQIKIGNLELSPKPQLRL